jgi:hypothetical protein
VVADERPALVARVARPQAYLPIVRGSHRLKQGAQPAAIHCSPRVCARACGSACAPRSAAVVWAWTHLSGGRARLHDQVAGPPLARCAGRRPRREGHDGRDHGRAPLDLAPRYSASYLRRKISAAGRRRARCRATPRGGRHAAAVGWRWRAPRCRGGSGSHRAGGEQWQRREANVPMRLRLVRGRVPLLEGSASKRRDQWHRRVSPVTGTGRRRFRARTVAWYSPGSEDVDRRPARGRGATGERAAGTNACRERKG